MYLHHVFSYAGTKMVYGNKDYFALQTIANYIKHQPILVTASV